ncbi:ABC transporter permease [Marinobacter halophilus]|uniref:Uncharacterized protein n=1 Tax=Marinobacter halophilus TaxID=1323740 RepID=A0A2T1KBT3_9GAMM|nr:ABC transporter permease [Marinobacter halophilus]PSF07589.1 hypothetical protein C7H08_11865 [Marinobacter halophilus]GGC56492.1 hypothetical protein GCM10011362_00970 [Marinobacter halophilus]
MSNKPELSEFSGAAFRAENVGPLPDSPHKRTRIGEELQPIGTYAEMIPYLRTIQDVEALQAHEKVDPEFKDKDWWSDHRRLQFLNGKLGLKFLMLILPLAWVLTLVIGGLGSIVWGTVHLTETYGLPAFIHLLLLFTLVPAWLIFSFWIIPSSTTWLMSTGIGFFLKPFETHINKKLSDTLEDGCSEFNRVTGQVRIALGKGRFFEAPFVEFDAYVDRVIQHGGIFFRLVLVHRYTQKTFNKTGFSTIEAEKSEVLALWDMLQRYMDVTQPLPDTPRLEPFRHLDPVTVEHDKKTGRNPRYWRDLDLEVWKEGEGWTEVHQRQSQFAWGSRRCKLTPQLGKISMEEYRKQRPEGAWPI